LANIDLLRALLAAATAETGFFLKKREGVEQGDERYRARGSRQTPGNAAFFGTIQKICCFLSKYQFILTYI
jgi:hypothetical protein